MVFQEKTTSPNSNWNVTYQGQSFHNNRYYSKVRVMVAGEIEERFFLAAYPTSNHEGFDTEESFISFAIAEFNKNNTLANTFFWLESSNIATNSTDFFVYRSEDNYISYAFKTAKQTVRSHPEKRWNEPKYWAAFILLDALD